MTTGVFDITHLIKVLIKEWGTNPCSINNGECADFAVAIYDQGGKEAGVLITSTAGAANVSDENASKAEPWHVWVVYEGKHYDAETPSGVVNWLNLPIFKKNPGDVCELKKMMPELLCEFLF